MATHPSCHHPLAARLSLLPAGLLLLAALGAAHQASGSLLTTISISKVPGILGHRMVYTMDMVFDRAPSDAWAFYEPRSSAIIIDLYGDTIDNEVVSLPRNLVFHNIRVQNMSTAMSLSGTRAQISVGVDPGWEVDLAHRGTDTLRLAVSRVVAVRAAAKPMPRRWSAYVFTTALAGLVSVGVLALLNR